ncbi:MAG TPA: hypothetical protein VE086_02130 [Chthoniobacterales bacterium]|nr:hypothetical protein [Chthoniobacterales bacterium]
MNGQPPPPPPPPSVPVPPIQPAPAYYPPPRSGMGCFAKGCLTVLVVGFLFCAIVGIGGWFFYKKTFKNLTSTEPADVQVQKPTTDQVKTAEDSAARLDSAISANKEATLEFTGPELNYLLQRNADLDFLRGRTRIDIADSTMTVAMSAPLDRLPWPGLKGRYFNGTIRFSMTYASNQFELEIISAEANGNQFPSSLLSSFNSSFNDSMNDEFRSELRKNARESEFWSHVKTVSLQGDKLIITTKPD